MMLLFFEISNIFFYMQLKIFFLGIHIFFLEKDRRIRGV